MRKIILSGGAASVKIKAPVRYDTLAVCFTAQNDGKQKKISCYSKADWRINVSSR